MIDNDSDNNSSPEATSVRELFSELIVTARSESESFHRDLATLQEKMQRGQRAVRILPIVVLCTFVLLGLLVLSIAGLSVIPQNYREVLVNVGSDMLSGAVIFAIITVLLERLERKWFSAQQMYRQMITAVFKRDAFDQQLQVLEDKVANMDQITPEMLPKIIDPLINSRLDLLESEKQARIDVYLTATDVTAVRGVQDLQAQLRKSIQEYERRSARWKALKDDIADRIASAK